jgi:cytochrome P450
MLRDEEVYPDPNVFNPDRFIKEGVLSFQETRDPREIIFGFGRRYIYYFPFLL